MASSFDKTKYLDTVSRYGMLKEGTSVLVGFSGGADSSLLLSLLSQTDGITVAAAHINHGIRGEEAIRDEYFCRRFCDENKITLYTKRVDIPKIAKDSGIGIEEAARNARYEFFNEICAEHGYDVIATAHNADDNLETVLFHLVRGTGIDGLCGIPPIRENIIRPLICYSKEEIYDGCREMSIPFIYDSTNSDTAYRRNFLRQEIIPKLKSINPSLCDTITRTTQLFKSDAGLLSELASEYSFQDGRASLSGLHDSILSRVIINELKARNIQFERDRINEMIAAIRSEVAHISLSINRTSFVCDRDLLYFENVKKETAFSFKPIIGLNVIDDESAIGIYYGDPTSQEEVDNAKNIYKLSIQAAISSDKINDNTLIRSRKNGDIIMLRGHKRKVKKLIQSLKMPSRDTDSLPFIECSGEIVYIPHFGPSDSAAPKDSNYFTVIYFKKGDK